MLLLHDDDSTWEDSCATEALQLHLVMIDRSGIAWYFLHSPLWSVAEARGLWRCPRIDGFFPCFFSLCILRWLSTKTFLL